MEWQKPQICAARIGSIFFGWTISLRNTAASGGVALSFSAANLASTSGFKGITKTYAFQPNGELVQSSVVIFLYKVVNDDFSTVGDVAALTK